MSSHWTSTGWDSSIERWFEENQYAHSHENGYAPSEHEAENCSDDEQTPSEDAESTESVRKVASVGEAQLAKTIKDGIHRCKQTIRESRVKCDKQKEEERQLHEVDMQALNESRERIKIQDLILRRRSEVHVRLPTNQVVTPAHNALVEEDTKEGILITESFKAIKDEKARLRTKLASRLEAMEEAHAKECALLGEQITRLRDIAELSAIELDETEAEDHGKYKVTALLICSQPSTPVQATPYTRKAAFRNTTSQQTIASGAHSYQRLKPAITRAPEDCHKCIILEEELSDARATISRIKATASVPKMQDFIQHGEQILAEIMKQYGTADEAASKELHKQKLATQAALDTLAGRHSRIKDIYIGIGYLWEHENKDLWQKTYDMCREELVRIKKEQEALDSVDSRHEEKLEKKQWGSKQLLAKQIKFYSSILSLARSEATNRWGDEELADSNSESESQSVSDSD